MLAKLILITLLLMSSSSFAYKLMVIQGVSKEKQTFITRGGKNSNITEGQKMTFTSDNVSLIAKAFTVTREFTQWEIENDLTDVPFTRGEMVTVYNAQEYLWTLTPEKIKRKYIKDNIFVTKSSMEAGIALTRGLSESTSGADPQNTDRGGYQFQGMYKKEFSINWAAAYGVRYTKEIINVPDASFTNYRFLGIAEVRYYFDPMENFYNSQLGLGLGFGFGQSRTEAAGQVNFGNTVLIPATKIMMTLPLNKKYDVEFNAAFENLRLDEQDSRGEDQTTNLTNAQFGVLIRKHL